MAVLTFEFPMMPSILGKSTSVQGAGWMWARVGAYFVIGFIACKSNLLAIRPGGGRRLTSRTALIRHCEPLDSLLACPLPLLPNFAPTDAIPLA